MSATPNRRQVLFSTDGHAGADILAYRRYLEQRYRRRFDEWAASYHDTWLEGRDRDRDLNHRIGVASAEDPANWDANLRLKLLDRQSIAAEVLFPNTSPPFYPSGAVTAPGPRTPEASCFIHDRQRCARRRRHDGRPPRGCHRRSCQPWSERYTQLTTPHK